MPPPSRPIVTAAVSCVITTPTTRPPLNRRRPSIGRVCANPLRRKKSRDGGGITALPGLTSRSGWISRTFTTNDVTDTGSAGLSAGTFIIASRNISVAIELQQFCYNFTYISQCRLWSQSLSAQYKISFAKNAFIPDMLVDCELLFDIHFSFTSVMYLHSCVFS